ncbi:MAG: hypothetical protein M3O34_10305 [Chloroflexota bacterium]|nr:hypothetical protein [Chloroflexota bacterium]
MTAEGRPWERRPDESAEAFAAFCAYRDLPPAERSVTNAWRRYRGGETAGRNGQWERYAARFDWSRRAAAWDDERDRTSRTAELDAIRDMRERHAKAAMFLQGKGLKVLSGAKYISPRTALDMVTKGMEAERLARGEPEDVPAADEVDALLDAVARDPQLAPLLVHLQGLGIDLEGDGSDDGEDAA